MTLLTSRGSRGNAAPIRPNDRRTRPTVSRSLWAVVAAVALPVTGVAPDTAWAGCPGAAYESDHTVWERGLLAFSEIPTDGRIAVWGELYEVEGIRSTDGERPSPDMISVEVTQPAGSGQILLYAPTSALSVGSHYEVVFSSRVDAEVATAPLTAVEPDETLPPRASVLDARFLGPSCDGGHLALRLNPWDGINILHEAEQSPDEDFSSIFTSWFLYDDPDFASGERGGFVRTRTWVSSGQFSDWSDPIEVRNCGCAVQGQADWTPNIAVLSLLAGARRRRRT